MPLIENSVKQWDIYNAVTLNRWTCDASVYGHAFEPPKLLAKMLDRLTFGRTVSVQRSGFGQRCTAKTDYVSADSTGAPSSLLHLYAPQSMTSRNNK